VLGAGHVYPRHADLGESQFTSPSLNLKDQLTAIDHHPPIVESTEAAPGATEAPVGASVRVTWQTEDDTRAFATRLALAAPIRHAFIELHGELGAGKTTFVRHLLRALGVAGRIKSPTYAMVEPHEAPDPLDGNEPPLSIWHFDFYRFNDPREWEEAGFRDIFASRGLKLVEWPEKAAGELPQPDLALHIDVRDDGSREVTLAPYSPAGSRMLEAAL